ncbi:MAG: D-TA family PLP-dependent enzyme [Planctomycetota bacterium]|nr:MAG: D-TA family PLP-dependent enzyme [Planctomycetota bacterium]
MNSRDLDTPALYIDLDVLERNLRAMQDRCRAMKVGLRPHTKTHKIPEIARMQLALGAVGLTAAKIGEAEVMPGDDILIAYPVLPDKLPRLRELARRRRVTICVESEDTARAMKGIECLVEVDIGFKRTGVQTPADYERVARACDRFRGLFYYPASMEEADVRKGADIVRECLVLKRGDVVSGGSTPNIARTPLFPDTTEVRPGTYAYNDAGVVAQGHVQPADCALRVLVSVVSTAVPRQFIVDGGSKTFSFNPTKIVGGYGRLVDHPLKLDRLFDEHGIVLGEHSVKTGDKLWVIPGHVGTCVNQHDTVWYGRGGKVEGKWTVAARGRVQ